MRINLMLKIGFTGTQRGMTGQQTLAIRQCLEEIVKHHPRVELHHGDCIGSDAQMHEIFRGFLVLSQDKEGNDIADPDWRIVIHPPDIDTKRAFCKVGLSISSHEPRPYLVRNHDIVDQSEILYATPQSYEERIRSGTWATIRYARKQRRVVRIIYPDGAIITTDGKGAI